MKPEPYPDFAEPLHAAREPLHLPQQVHPGWDVVQAERRYGPILGRVLRAETLSEDTPTDLASREHPVGPYRYDEEPL